MLHLHSTCQRIKLFNERKPKCDPVWPHYLSSCKALIGAPFRDCVFQPLSQHWLGGSCFLEDTFGIPVLVYLISCCHLKTLKDTQLYMIILSSWEGKPLWRASLSGCLCGAPDIEGILIGLNSENQESDIRGWKLTEQRSRAVSH